MFKISGATRQCKTNVTMRITFLRKENMYGANSIDYYDTLGCTRESSTEDIKRAYHALALKCHPDKNLLEPDRIKFQRISEAWNVLRDPTSRREYDAVQKQIELDSDNAPVHARVSVNELETIDNKEDTFIYRCRCGGLYAVQKEYIQQENQFVYVPCSECTFVIVVET